ncbi:glycoside hydrolase family 28 protein [Granulicella mallensis]|uniref:Polygalacturonase n=1 Tax=Granulicella mallensis TaxID=940614 RepID=A0A7W8E8U6_9BACT|nr:glycoside hydrolase family 28 protein [Granulicella mallensis]MBB5062914.1 polygalacturonase [Granulicella mallensis]
MDRRDLLKLSPLALASTIGHIALAESPAPAAAEAVFNVRTYGATGDGKTVDTPAINKAIEAVAAAGGGTLLFPAGTYMCFTIHLRSRVDLYLSRGCTILAADSPKPGETTGYNGGTYDAAEPNKPWEEFQDYGHNHWRNSLFYGENLDNFSILGPGLIHGSGLSCGTRSRQAQLDQNSPRGRGLLFDAEQAGVGNKAIALKNCHNVLLRDFSVLKGGHFALLATGVDNLTLDNLLIDTDRDGFDIDCCRNVRVTNCTVNSPWDDAICPKSSYALGYARSTDNVTIANCFVSGTYELGSVVAGTWKKFAAEMKVSRNGRIKCGTESNGGFRNITISNCVCEGSKGLSLETSDGALLEDIAISNITLRDTVDAPLFLRLNRRNRGPKDTMRPGTLRRVAISNIVSHNSLASTASIFSGIPENLIEDVKLSNCFFGHKGLPTDALTGWGDTSKPMPDWHNLQVPEIEDAYPELLRFGPTPSNGFFIRHLKNLEMSHVEVAPQNPDPRPAFWLEDVHRADFFAVTAPGAANFNLRKVTDLRILWSRAAKDTTLANVESQTL